MSDLKHFIIDDLVTGAALSREQIEDALRLIRDIVGPLSITCRVPDARRGLRKAPDELRNLDEDRSGARVMSDGTDAFGPAITVARADPRGVMHCVWRAEHEPKQCSRCGSVGQFRSIYDHRVHPLAPPQCVGRICETCGLIQQ